MFPESYGFVAVSITMSSPFTNIDRDKLEHDIVYLILLVTVISTKPRLSGNMLPNIKICENR